MSATAEFSEQIAFDPSMGYYFDPFTLEAIDDATAAALVQSEHAAGFLVDGIDTQSNAGGPGTGSTPVTPAMNQANLDAAAAQAISDAGLSGISRGSWTQSQAVDYISRFKALILANPDQFSAATLQVAQNIHIQSDLGDSSGRGLYDEAAVQGAILDYMEPSIDLLTPFARIPNTVVNASNVAVNATNSLIGAVDKAAKAIDSISGIGVYLIPIAFIGFLFLAVQSAGRDPGAQGKKIISAFV